MDDRSRPRGAVHRLASAALVVVSAIGRWGRERRQGRQAVELDDDGRPIRFRL